MEVKKDVRRRYKNLFNSLVFHFSVANQGQGNYHISYLRVRVGLVRCHDVEGLGEIHISSSTSQRGVEAILDVY